MIVTEKEAKTKWCPEARVENESETGSVNRDFGKGFPVSDCMCLGSGCMHWRWMALLPRYQSSTMRDGWEHISASDAALDFERNTEFWLEPEADWLARRKGFCGKAGWPHHA